jgi:glycosyltransferase involved in cell wall biosynthesis
MSQRFIAIQTGARRNYVIPSVLEHAGLLEVLYTDVCGDAGLGRALDLCCPPFLKRGGVARLLNRRVPQNLRNKVRTVDLCAFRYAVRRYRAGDDQVNQYRALSTYVDEFGRSLIKRGVGRATHVFTTFGDGLPFLEVAKREGLGIVADIYTSPLTYRIVEDEKRRYPGLEPFVPQQVIDASRAWFEKFVSLVDVFVTPSSFVRRGLAEFGVPEAKCPLVPYSVDGSWLKTACEPEKGRVLFAGTAGVGKGIHVLGMAAGRLAHRGYDFRVAGNVSDAVRRGGLTRGLNFLGRVPRARIRDEFSRADVFVLPTLAEGSAGATYEALAAGVPVVTTEAAGSVVRDGVDGFIIPTSDAEALAGRVEQLVEDRALRERMSRAARARAREYTFERYAERLVEACRTA